MGFFSPLPIIHRERENGKVNTTEKKNEKELSACEPPHPPKRYKKEFSQERRMLKDGNFQVKPPQSFPSHPPSTTKKIEEKKKEKKN